MNDPTTANSDDASGPAHAADPARDSSTRNAIEPDDDVEIRSSDNTEPEYDLPSREALEGEPGIPSVTQARGRRLSRKAIVSLLMMILAIALVAAAALSRATAKDAEEKKKLASDLPTAAAASTRKLDMSPPAAAPAPAPVIPAIRPSPEEVEPIGVRRTGNPGAPGSPSNGQKPVSPEDAPVLLLSSRPGAAQNASQSSSELGHESPGGRTSPSDPMSGTRRSLEAYQRQLQGMMDSLAQGTTLAGQGGGAGLNTASAPSSGLTGGFTGGAAGATPSMPTGPRAGSGSAGLFGGELSRSSTPRVSAGQLGDRNLVLPKGTSFTCALKTRVVSATSGLIGCQVQRNVYSDNGRVLLIERGSHLDGEYRMTTVRPVTVRIPVLWTRLRTPNGVTVDIDSPGTGPLGESGIDGHVDNRWGERIGAALLLSVIDDAVRLVIQNQSSEGGGNTVILQSTTGSANKLAEKVLDSTINIPPLIYQNQGGIVGIYVARDVDFGSVYQLESIDAGGAR